MSHTILPDLQPVCSGTAPVPSQLTSTVLEQINSVDTTKPPTRKQVKDLLRLYFTVRRPVIEGCGHRIDTEHEPRGNCQLCWFAWFNYHGELVQNIDKLLHEPGGQPALIGLRGRKFYRMFLKFMATIAQWKATAEAAV